MASREAMVLYMSFRWSFCEGLHQTELQFKSPLKLQREIGLVSEDYVFQLECTQHEGHDNLHYQGYVKLDKKQRPKTLGRSLNEVLYGIQFSAAANPEALKSYCMKTETRVAGPWSKHYKYNGEDLSVYRARPWQAEAERIIMATEGDSRHICCVYNPQGNIGKSMFCKYMEYNNNCLKMTFAKASDLLYLASQQQGRRAFLFDFTRTHSAEYSIDDVYEAMENLKNGHYISSKYEVQSVLTKQPHVWMFTNMLPSINKLTFDRWIFYQVNEDMELTPISTEEVLSLQKVEYRAFLKKKLKRDLESKSLKKELLKEIESELEQEQENKQKQKDRITDVIRSSLSLDSSDSSGGSVPSSPLAVIFSP